MKALDERTAQLHERVRLQPQNRQLAQEVDESVGSPRLSGDRDVCIVLIPGLLFKDFPDSGADGSALRVIAEAFSIPFYTISLDGTEGLRAATSTIAKWLELCCPQRSVILISLSKGSAEVMNALNQPTLRHSFRQVVAWISVSGLPFGTPSMEMIMSNPLRRIFLGTYCFLKGWNLNAIRDVLGHRPIQAVALPSHILLVQVIAFPLHEHLTDRPSRRLHRQLALVGPNDGYALLDELTGLPGYIYPVWGADHYLRGMADQPARLARLLAFVLKATEKAK